MKSSQSSVFNHFKLYLLCLLLPIFCYAQQAPPPFYPGSLKAGDMVKIEQSEGEVIQGVIQQVDSTSLTLARDSLPEIVVPFGEIQRLWYRARSVKRGAITGAVIAGAGTAIYAIVLGAVGISESGAENSPSIFAIGLVGGVIGALGGGAVGGLVGAAIPHWKLYYSAIDSPAVVPQKPKKTTSRSRMGCTAFLLGGGSYHGYAGETAIITDRFQLSAYVRNRVLVGMELGFGQGGAVSLRYLGALGMYSLNTGIIRVYGMLGLGVYSWEHTFTSLTGSLGVMMVYPMSKHLRGLFEMRLHQNLQYDDVDLGFWHMMPGLLITW